MQGLVLAPRAFVVPSRFYAGKGFLPATGNLEFSKSGPRRDIVLYSGFHVPDQDRTPSSPRRKAGAFGSTFGKVSGRDAADKANVPYRMAGKTLDLPGCDSIIATSAPIRVRLRKNTQARPSRSPRINPETAAFHHARTHSPPLQSSELDVCFVSPSPSREVLSPCPARIGIGGEFAKRTSSGLPGAGIRRVRWCRASAARAAWKDPRTPALSRRDASDASRAEASSVD
jgi:hypothetical protein